MRITTFLLGLAVAFTAVPAEAKSGGGHHYVRSYTTHRGTRVQGHYQTNPNHSRADNWSTRGNIDPTTGKAGTKPLWRE